MKLVPGTVLDFQSSAEERVFNLLKQVNLGPNDVALHSLNLGKHAYKRWGEADLLIVSTKGLFLIEVKGGRVACRNGVWEYGGHNSFDRRRTFLGKLGRACDVGTRMMRERNFGDGKPDTGN